MSHGKLRKDQTCLNCGHQVTEHYCPKCGQENTETKQPFYFLFTHFVEDLTHYDGQFWGTIKNLLFKPGKLTNVYLEGKRQVYVPPVKLYIFMSFITFFIFSIFPPFEINYTDNKIAETSTQQKQLVEQIKKTIEEEKLQTKDSLAIAQLNTAQQIFQDSAKVNNFQKGIESTLDFNNKMANETTYKGYKSQEEYDKGTKGKLGFLGFIDTAFAHKFFELKEKGVKKGDIFKSLAENSFHNLPKALFIYLPLFAFFLWIFHNKKRWWYFDHGVFTLHYFSFLLMLILTVAFLFRLSSILDNYHFIGSLISFIILALLCYMVVYFFIAHHRVYKSSRFTSIFIGFILLFINLFAFSILMAGLLVTSFIVMH